MTETWTIKKLLDWSQNYFQNKGIESARLDAELLLSSVLKIERMQLYLQFDRPLTKEELRDYKAFVQRRSQLEPIAYIIGEKEFYSRVFKVTPDVLIPRPDTEVLIEKTLDALSQHSSKDLLGLEVGSGSGCIAVTLLCENSSLKMHVFEKSQAACEVTYHNAKLHNANDRIKIECLDFLENSFENLKAHFDFIVSNPPYISHSEFKELDAGILNFEPHLALKGGDDGLHFYPALLQFGQSYLKPNGFLAVEIGNEQADAVQNLFSKSNYKKTKLSQDYGGKDRVVIGHI